MIYLVSISIAVLCAWCLNHTKGFIWYVFFVMAIFVPALVWGVRSINMGIDVNLYALPIWEYSKNLRTFDYGSLYGGKIEPGYLLINFALTRIFDDIHWLLFILAFLACFFVLQGLVNFELRNYAWIGYATYLTLFLPRTINLVRQGFAMAILIAAISAFFQRKWKLYCSLTLLATLFHNSSLIAFSFPVAYLIFRKKNGSLRQISMSIIIIVIMLLSQTILSHLLFLNDKYEIYLNGSFKPHFTIFSLTNLPFIITFGLYYKSIKKRFSYFAEELFMLIAGVVFSQLSWVVAVYLARVAQPYNIFIVFAPMLLLTWVKDRFGPKVVDLMKVCILLYVSAYFFLVFFVNGESSIFPYYSEPLDSLFRSI